ncbi:MAG TPA: rod shape-determining protein MreC [Acidimicrobiales bacterium]|nr:rod shape-determining protein MreC [Acidimicrobiales bacterium]HVC70697.1 rod shape-determining protein MreC [Acidimicrobiales bacterium]
MARTRRPRRPRLTIGLLVLASISIITLDYRGDAHGAIGHLKSAASDAFSPVQRVVDDVTHPIGSFLAGAVNGAEIERDNAKLRQEVGRLQGQVLAHRATANALKAIDQLNHLTWTEGIPTVTAQVIALNSSNFAATVELNVGSRRGVTAGMPVVGGAGLVGQVISTTSTTSTVRLITDAGSAVGVRYGPTSLELALAQGDGIGKPLDINFISPGTPLHTGEVLTTSGLQNGLFPPLIPVARITSFRSTASSTQENVSAQPVADLAQLDYVDVLQWPPAG